MRETAPTETTFKIGDRVRMTELGRSKVRIRFADFRSLRGTVTLAPERESGVMSVLRDTQQRAQRWHSAHWEKLPSSSLSSEPRNG